MSAGFDLIIVGGGIHGVCLALESARRGLRPLLLERGGFGEATSDNSQRIIHGGLRYLQSLQFSRMLESVSEQRWFLDHFPHLVHPLTCLMPLYGGGLRTPFCFGIGLRLHSLLAGCIGCRALPRGRVVSAAETASLYPDVNRAGLRGAGLWQDAIMSNSHQLLMELIEWARACGATALDHVEAEALRTADRRVVGVVAGGEPYDAPVVVNCAGPWCQQVARRFDPDAPERMPMLLTFGILLDRQPLSECAVAVSSREQGARMYFLVPWKNRILAGIDHLPSEGSVERPRVREEQIGNLLTGLNNAVPGLEARRDKVVHLFAGRIPAVAAGSDEPSNRTLILDHAASHGGPRGLFSVSGVKYTTARFVAEQVVRRIFGRRPYRTGPPRPSPNRVLVKDVPATETALQQSWTPTQDRAV